MSTYVDEYASQQQQIPRFLKVTSSKSLLDMHLVFKIQHKTPPASFFFFFFVYRKAKQFKDIILRDM